MIAVALFAGVAMGVTLGALGGGGAIIAVPVLIYALGHNPAEATTASLVIVGTSSLTGSLAHRQHGNVRYHTAMVFAVFGLIGTTLGSKMSMRIEPDILLIAFSILTFCVAWMMWRKPRKEAPFRRRPLDVSDAFTFKPKLHIDVALFAKVVLAAIVVGFLTGFFGVGGGFAVVPALVMVLRFPMPVAVGTSLVVIALNSATALASRLSYGVDLDWGVVIVFTVAAMIGTYVGPRASKNMSPLMLSRIFAAVLMVTAVFNLIKVMAN